MHASCIRYHNSKKAYRIFLLIDTVFKLYIIVHEKNIIIKTMKKNDMLNAKIFDWALL